MQVTGHPIPGPLATPPPGPPIGRRRPALRGPTFRDPSQDQVPGPNGPLLARIPVFPFLCGISPVAFSFLVRGKTPFLRPEPTSQTLNAK
ncbi:hypothetical protein CABS01_16020 [Colletotrichum abscissum]|uniref:Uncharacterized protein n=1 Tax=Colletotrichum abscissum TaxID=1671311 RepID=A0A9Q0AWP7_9PEZI|nr:uncharacterized protein CABS01_16020 [Colletotrichum abscissum]KAI3530039.1 hypothetical protein CABS02_14637 [Colletotrichum abscissum]KAK1474041.1 hypothetical protein CABS01_16020 [Colletotrichum abscissum]